jgi:tetratricopeptide (TPR) repeat protein
MTLHSFDPLALPFILSASLVVTTSVGFFLCRRRWPGPFALWLCYLALLVPVLGLSEYPHSPYDRYSYFPGVFWSVGVALLLRVLWRHGKRGYLASATVTAASLLFGLLAWQQVGVWRHTIPLYQHLLTHVGDHPDRSRFDLVLGVNYLRAGLTNEGVASFQRAVFYESGRRNRDVFDEGVLPVAHVQWANVLAEQGKPEEALVHYQSAIQANPASFAAAFGTGITLSKLDRADEAATWLKKAAQIRPNSVSAHHELGVVLEKLGNQTEAQQHFEAERRLQEQDRCGAR